MNLRHIRAFIAVAEELHFGRAAKRLHIEQSPLSRTIRKMEDDLGLKLLLRSSRGVALTLAGKTFLEDARHIVLAVEQAEARARAASLGYHGTLRVGLTRDIGRSKLAALLALYRSEAPMMNIRLTEVPLTQLLHGLSTQIFDAGLALIDHADGVEAIPVWEDPIVVALPARHPLLALKTVPLDQVR
jgi:DNA-binding transcriptional LysR family regulator